MITIPRYSSESWLIGGGTALLTRRDRNLAPMGSNPSLSATSKYGGAARLAGNWTRNSGDRREASEFDSNPPPNFSLQFSCPPASCGA